MDFELMFICISFVLISKMVKSSRISSLLFINSNFDEKKTISTELRTFLGWFILVLFRYILHPFKMSNGKNRNWNLICNYAASAVLLGSIPNKLTQKCCDCVQFMDFRNTEAMNTSLPKVVGKCEWTIGSSSSPSIFDYGLHVLNSIPEKITHNENGMLSKFHPKRHVSYTNNRSVHSWCLRAFISHIHNIQPRTSEMERET